jgi:hypothetical protein
MNHGPVEHALGEIELNQRRATTRFVAHCTCGWRSAPLPNPGLVHRAFDDHVQRRNAGEA